VRHLPAATNPAVASDVALARLVAHNSVVEREPRAVDPPGGWARTRCRRRSRLTSERLGTRDLMVPSKVHTVGAVSSTSTSPICSGRCAPAVVQRSMQSLRSRAGSPCSHLRSDYAVAMTATSGFRRQGGFVSCVRHRGPEHVRTVEAGNRRGVAPSPHIRERERLRPSRDRELPSRCRDRSRRARRSDPRSSSRRPYRGGGGGMRGGLCWVGVGGGGVVVGVGLWGSMSQVPRILLDSGGRSYGSWALLRRRSRFRHRPSRRKGLGRPQPARRSCHDHSNALISGGRGGRRPPPRRVPEPGCSRHRRALDCGQGTFFFFFFFLTTREALRGRRAYVGASAAVVLGAVACVFCFFFERDSWIDFILEGYGIEHRFTYRLPFTAADIIDADDG